MSDKSDKTEECRVIGGDLIMYVQYICTVHEQ